MSRQPTAVHDEADQYCTVSSQHSRLVQQTKNIARNVPAMPFALITVGEQLTARDAPINLLRGGRKS